MAFQTINSLPIVESPSLDHAFAASQGSLLPDVKYTGHDLKSIFSGDSAQLDIANIFTASNFFNGKVFEGFQRVDLDLPASVLPANLANKVFNLKPNNDGDALQLPSSSDIFNFLLGLKGSNPSINTSFRSIFSNVSGKDALIVQGAGMSIDMLVNDVIPTATCSELIFTLTAGTDAGSAVFSIAGGQLDTSNSIIAPEPIVENSLIVRKADGTYVSAILESPTSTINIQTEIAADSGTIKFDVIPSTEVTYPSFYHDGGYFTETLNTASFTMSSFAARDSTDSHNILVQSDVTVNGSSVGLNGLDAGTFAANTLYYVYAIQGTSVPGGFILSTNGTAPTYPTGYSWNRLRGSIKSSANSLFFAANFVPVGFINTNGLIPSIVCIDVARTITIADMGKLLLCQSASTQVMTLPSDAAAPMPIGAIVYFSQNGGGTISYVAGSGAYVESQVGTTPKSFDIKTRQSAHKILANTWEIFGAIKS